ncbi:IS66 family insertion sequence element accessory protein TnpA, partial [Sphingobacterium sp.]
MNNLEEKRERMLSMIAEWHRSGKSKKAYCAENGINEATFYYWFSR